MLTLIALDLTGVGVGMTAAMGETLGVGELVENDIDQQVEVVDYVVWSFLALGVSVVSGGMAGAAWLAFAGRRQPRDPRKQAAPPIQREVIEGPLQVDGSWIRMVEIGRGRRRLEVLSPTGWVASDRDVSWFMSSVPRPRGKLL